MRRVLLALALLVASRTEALTCAVVEFDGAPFSYCEADPAVDRITMAATRADGSPIGGFEALVADLGQPPAMAMNAGMFRPDLAPAGLYIEKGVEQVQIARRAGPGNFGMLPNGVFCVGEAWAQVIETLTFDADRPECHYASQSGPMLVIDGALHPRFLPDSTSRYIRNGVGTSDDGRRVVFAISDRPVTFHHFARFYRDFLGLGSALYFDGNVSRLFAPQLGRSDAGRPVGPMVVISE